MQTVVKLSGRITTINGNQVEEYIRSQISSDTDSLILDAENLEYISSVGLRITLKLKKEIPNTSVINCNSNVYEIFSVSGFAEMMEITKAYRQIPIKGCQKIGSGFFGDVYRLDDETIVKVYKRPDCLEMIKSEQQLAKKAFVMGIPTAIPYDIVRVGNLYGTVFELLDAVTVVDLINDEDSIKEFCKKAVSVLKQMHSTHVDKKDFPRKVDQVFLQLEGCKECFSEKTYQKLMMLLQNLSEVDTLIHSDFHIKNIMMQNDELLLIDMDKLSIGQPLFEFAAMYATYVAFGCIDKNNCMEFLGIPNEKAELIFNTTFDLYYEDKTKHQKAEIFKRIKLFAYLFVLYLRKHYGNLEDKLVRDTISYSANYVANLANQIDSLE